MALAMEYGAFGKRTHPKPNNQNQTMKLLLTAFCAAMITTPFAFAEGKCDKKKCDKDKEESTLVAEKCKKKCDEEKEESTLVADKCKDKCDDKDGCDDEATLIAEKCKKKCDKEESEEESTLAHCGKCGKGDKHEKEEEEKKEGTLA
jgi:hypothetical protein